MQPSSEVTFLKPVIIHYSQSCVQQAEEFTQELHCDQRRSYVELTSRHCNLWQNGHTGTSMANHTIVWEKQIRHKHAHTHTYRCYQMKNLYLQFSISYVIFCCSNIFSSCQIIIKKSPKLELTCSHLTTIICVCVYIYKYIYIYTLCKLTQALVILLYYIFKHQQSDIFCLFTCPAELAQKHKYTQPYTVYTNSRVSTVIYHRTDRTGNYNT